MVKSSTLSHSFDVGTDISDLTVRLGHAVLEENAVSLVSFAAGDESNEQIDKNMELGTNTRTDCYVYVG